MILEKKEEFLYDLLKRIILAVLLTFISWYISLYDPFFSSNMLAYAVLGYIFLIIDWVYSRPEKSLSRKIFPKLVLICIFIIFIVLGILVYWIYSLTPKTNDSFQALILMLVIFIVGFSYIAYLLLHKIEKDLSEGKGKIQLRGRLEY